MLHEILQLDRPLILFDLETTGTTDGSRIVEIGFQVYTREGVTKEWNSLVNPEIPIPAEVAAIHGITDEMVKVCRFCGKPAEHHPHDNPGIIPCLTFGPILTFAQLAPNLAVGFQDCDYGGKNVRFDLRIFDSEMRRVGVPWSYADAKVIDAERLEQIAVPRTLSHLYEKYTGQKHDSAHRALDDVKASAAVLFHQLQHHPTLPRNLNDLHELQWPGRIDSEGKFVVRNGEVVCTFGKHRGARIQLIPPDYWRYMLKNDFPAELKALAENALKGVYPRVTK